MHRFILASLFLFSVLLLLTPLQAQDSTAAVYFVYGSDTSTPGINVRDKSSLYHDRGFELFASPAGNAARVMDSNYRSQFLDSYGQPLKLTWWMQGASLYRYAENTNLPYGSTMSLYLMQKYHGDKVESLGDEMTFHYHTWVWSDVNGDGKYWWNQAFSFNETKEDFDIALAEHFLEENMFPVSFRSGWHYMDNAWQQHLNKWIPFSLHNDSPTHTNPTIEPIDNLIDWGHATTDFVPFRPSETDYQVGGGNGGWNTRSQYFLSLSEADLRQIFEQARQGVAQVATIWGHLAETNFLVNMEQSLALLYKVSEEYPDVPFHFSTAVDAMQGWLKNTDNEAPLLTLNTIADGNNFHVEVTSNEAIFQTVPFLAVKNIYEQHRIVEMEQTGELTWRTVDPIDASITSKWGVAITDSVGNLSKRIVNLLPDDIYLDNADISFETTGTGWILSDFNEVEHIWDRNFSQIVLNEADSASARWTTTAPSSHRQQVFIRFPDVDDLVNDVSVQIFLGATEIKRTILNNIIPNSWIFVDFIQPDADQQISVQVNATGLGERTALAADVIKISPLIKDKQIKLPLGTLDLGSLVINESHSKVIPIKNLGSEDLVINEITSALGLLSVEQNMPFTIPPYSSMNINITLFSDAANMYTDSLIIHSDDPVNSIMKKMYLVEFRNYFELVDNENESGYEESGTWNTSSTQIHGESSRYSYINSTNSASASFTFSVDIAGYYDVAFIVPITENAADRADYTVYINNEEVATFQVNQNINSGNWLSLDLIYFEPGSSIKLEVKATDPDQPNKVLRADAARLSLIGSNLSEVILDNDSDAYSEEGEWKTSVTQAYGESSRYALSSSSTATFKYITQESSPHVISIIVPEAENSSHEAQYSILKNGVHRDNIILNQNANSGKWVTLGNWAFQSGDTLSVRIQNNEKNNGAFVLRTDAVKIQYASEAVTSTEHASVPDTYNLAQNYPNPFNPATVINISLPENTHVTLTIYDMLGRKVATLLDDKKSAGEYHIQFMANNLSSGVYFYRLTTNNFDATKKMLLLK